MEADVLLLKLSNSLILVPPSSTSPVLSHSPAGKKLSKVFHWNLFLFLFTKGIKVRESVV